MRQEKSNSIIRKELRGENFKLSNRYLTKLRQEIKEGSKSIKKVEARGRKNKLSIRQQNALKAKLLKENPDTITNLANYYNVDRHTIRYYRDGKFGLKKRSKCRVHALTARAMAQRHPRSWPLYLAMRGKRWMKWITSDEKKFIIAECNNKTKIYYVDPKNPGPQLKLDRTPQGNRGVMVWAAISAYGRSQLHFVGPKVKINARYYIDMVLKPFFDRELATLCPNGDYVFYQDSAPAHRADLTTKWLNDNGIKYLQASKWLANSPDCSPLDYSIWRQLFLRVRKRNRSTLRGLKKVLREEWAKLPQKIIYNAMKAWPKRLRHCYYAKGSQFEHKLK